MVNPKEFERFELSGISEELGAFALAGATYTEVKVIKRGTCWIGE